MLEWHCDWWPRFLALRLILSVPKEIPLCQHCLRLGENKVENIDYRTVDENACLLKLPGKINPTKLVENVHEINRQSDVRSWCTLRCNAVRRLSWMCWRGLMYNVHKLWLDAINKSRTCLCLICDHYHGVTQEFSKQYWKRQHQSSLAWHRLMMQMLW